MLLEVFDLVKEEGETRSNPDPNIRQTLLKCGFVCLLGQNKSCNRSIQTKNRVCWNNSYT